MGTGDDAVENSGTDSSSIATSGSPLPDDTLPGDTLPGDDLPCRSRSTGMSTFRSRAAV